VHGCKNPVTVHVDFIQYSENMTRDSPEITFRKNDSLAINIIYTLHGKKIVRTKKGGWGGLIV
jgi:hypothetical protein